ncbi:MAG: enoyl-CoA hydratase/isomerase family protein [Phycisphaerae bacterium]|nr:enoyl-CoA hydratase/isomerase family protein [Phycisphaerae bacterium]
MNSALLHERTPDGIVFLSLVPNPAKPRGGVVVLDAWLIDELRRVFDALAHGPAPTGFVLCSASPRVFIAGADLAEIDALDDRALDAHLRAGADAFGRIPRLPCPSVAAINSSALGGGLEIAMHCDALIGVATSPTEKPYRIGLPEAGLAICPGWGGTQMLAARIDPATAIRATALGETWKSTEVPAGLFAETTTTVAELRAAATRWIGGHPRTTSRSHPISIDGTNRQRVLDGLDAAFSTISSSASIAGQTLGAAAAVKDAIEIGIRDGWERAIEAERAHLVRLRHTPEARAKLDAFFSKS